jgi:hypothetical protein
VTGEDVARVRALRDSLAGMAADLAQHKKSLRDASLEGGALRALPSPRVLVERLVANIAPIVQEIGKRSLAPGELVLKRLLDDTRREEIFVSKKELARKVQVLPQDMRRIFDPLELASGPGAAVGHRHVVVESAPARSSAARAAGRAGRANADRLSVVDPARTRRNGRAGAQQDVRQTAAALRGRCSFRQGGRLARPS